jgi:surface antigen
MYRSLVKWAGAALTLIIVCILLLAGCLAVLTGPQAAGCAPTGNIFRASDKRLGSGLASLAFFSQFPENIQVKQKEHAAMIISIGVSRGRNAHDIRTMLGAAIQESKLQNLPYGDADSLGLFQMRPLLIEPNGVPTWGTASQIMDPTYAINRMYRELEGVANRESYSLMELAIKIEKPNPIHYYQNWKWDAAVIDLTRSLEDPAQPPVLRPVDVEADTCPGVSLTGSAIGGDDYPYPEGPLYTNSPVGYYYRECVDFVAWRLNVQSGITRAPFKFQGYGNAVTWKERLVAEGYKADRTPAVGAVAWWDAYTGDGSLRTGEFGHVAIVSAVHADGSITVEQYNTLPFADHGYNKMDLPVSYLNNLTFIHVADIKG